MNYYEVLEVSCKATEKQIKAAYRRKVVESHQDKWPSNLSSDERKIREDNWNLLQRAYEVLRDPSKRASYDIYGEKDSNPLGGDLLESLLSETRTHQFAVVGLTKKAGVDRLITEIEYLTDVKFNLRFFIVALQKREKLYREALAYLELDEVEKQIVLEEIKSNEYGRNFLKREMDCLKKKLEVLKISQESQGVTDWKFLLGLFEDEEQHPRRD